MYGSEGRQGSWEPEGKRRGGKKIRWRAWERGGEEHQQGDKYLGVMEQRVLPQPLTLSTFLGTYFTSPH